MTTAAMNGNVGLGFSTSALIDALDELTGIATREPEAVRIFLLALAGGEKVTAVLSGEQGSELAPSGFLKSFLNLARRLPPKPGEAP